MTRKTYSASIILTFSAHTMHVQEGLNKSFFWRSRH